MFESFKIIFSQILVLFSFIAIGYGMRKCNKLPDGFNKGISNLLVYVLVPCLLVESTSKNFNLDVIAEKKNIILISVLLMVAFFLIAFMFSRALTKDKNARDICMYSFSFPNYGYFGNPLVLAIFGEMMLFEYIIFTIPFMILTYTFGIYTLDPNKTFNFKKLINPVVLSLVAGMVIGACSIQLPAEVKTIISTGASCMAPMAMILTGVVFASNDLKNMLSNPKMYVAFLIKMILIPLVVVLIMSRFDIPENIAALIIPTITLPPGLNGIIFPESSGRDSSVGAQLCLVSTLMFIVAFPLVYSIYQYLCA